MSRIPWASRNAVSPKELGLEFADLNATLRSVLQRLAILERASTTTVSGSVTLSGANFQTDSVAIVAGSNAVVFPTVMPDTSFIVIPRAFNASNNALSVELSGYTTAGFTCTSPEAGTLEYFVVSATVAFSFSLDALQSGTAVLAGGSETITLGTAMASGTYAVLPFAFDSGNAVMSVEISNKTTTTFDVLAPSAGTLNYVVLA